MAKYLVKSVDIAHRNGVKTMVIEADSSTIAKALAAAKFDGDDVWGSADVVDLTAAFAADFEGFRYRVRVGHKPVDQATADAAGITLAALYEVEYTGIASDTVDLVGAALKALLIAAGIATADYNTGTNVLTVAASGENLGKCTLAVDVFPPSCIAPLTSLRSTFVHQAGSDGTALSCVLVAPTAIPAVKALL